ncbi:transmembrane protein 273-like [Scomber scombrus]
MSVRGDGEDSTEKLEIKYVLIGTGVGLFLLILFIIFKFCTIRKELRNSNCTASHGHFEQSQPIRTSRGGGLQ